MVTTSTVIETSKAWMVEVEVNDKMVNFKIDTGAAVTAVPKSLMQVLPSLSPTDKTLRGAGNHKLSLFGKASVVLTFRDKRIKDTVYVVDGLVNPLLGKPAIAGLGVLGFIQEVDLDTDWVKRFSHSVSRSRVIWI